MQRLATVIIPTHSHDSSLPRSIESVLEQSFEDFDLVVIGDGISAFAKRTVMRYAEQDERVRLVDVPKQKGHAERIRDAVIRESNSWAIAYHGDDDLMLPNHLAELLAFLQDYDFAHTLPVTIAQAGQLSYFPTDIRRQECLDWHMQDSNNAISLTGVVHTKQSYMRLPEGWTEAPKNRWSDHYMWQKFFRNPTFRGITSRKATVIKLPASIWATAGSRSEPVIEEWWRNMHTPGFQEVWERKVLEAIFDCSVNLAHLGPNVSGNSALDTIRPRIAEDLEVATLENFDPIRYLAANPDVAAAADRAGAARTRFARRHLLRSGLAEERKQFRRHDSSSYEAGPLIVEADGAY